MQFAICLHDCDDDQFALYVHLQDSSALQNMPGTSRDVRFRVALSFGLGFILVLQYPLYAIVEANYGFVVSVEFLRLVPDC